MTWTYSGQPGTGSTDQQQDAIRLLSGQTSSSDPVVLHDEELAFLLSEGGNVYAAAALACETLAGRYAGRADSKRVGDLSLTYGKRGDEYRARALSLRRQLALRAVPFAGGISVANKLFYQGDTDRVSPQFGVGMDDNPAGVMGFEST